MILKTIVILAAFYGVFTLCIYLFQDFIFFQPISLQEDYVFPFEQSTEIWLETSDQQQLNALYFKSPTVAKGIIVYFHGNRGNLSRWGKVHSDFTNRSYDLLIIDYRGYGKSSGKASEEGLYEDARTAYHWAKQHYAAQDIILYGRSLGSGVASRLATEVDAKMLILETPFYSIPDAIQRRLPFIYFPFAFRTEFPNYQHLPKISYPIHVFHGTNDRLVRYSSAIQLQALLRCKECFISIKGGGHKNLGDFQSYQEYLDEIL